MSAEIASDQVIATARPGSDHPYLTQLSCGFRSLRFDGPLESEYRKTLETEQRPAALLCAAMAVAIWLGFAISDVYRTGLLDGTITTSGLWLVLISRWSLLVIISVWCLTPWRLLVPLQRSAFTIYTLIGVVSAVNGIIYKAHGIASPDAALVVVVMAAFLPMGLTFSRALSAALLVVIVTIAAGMIAFESDQIADHMRLVLIMAIAVAVGAAGGYLREHAHRRQFLLTAILSRQAQFDHLTDLANRRLFQRHAEAVIAHAARNDDPLVLAILDIDHFKAFNDSFGHAAGDQALSAIADAIAAAARRPMDLAARVGGEEFALLLYGCDLDRARLILEALRLRISDLPVQPGGDPLSISIGASMLRHGDDLTALLARADNLLYASKSNGRNRLSVDAPVR